MSYNLEPSLCSCIENRGKVGYSYNGGEAGIPFYWATCCYNMAPGETYSTVPCPE
jgi:hypothetical protein